MLFNGKIVLVTGSSRGIGKAIAETFAEKGAIVVVHGSQSSTSLNQTYENVVKQSPDSIKITTDLSKSTNIESMFTQIINQFGRVDILVNNAAVQNPVQFVNLSEHDWDHVMNVNLKAPFLCSQHAARSMIANGGGKIINIGSVHEIQPKRHYAHYSSAKGGLLMLTKNMAMELAPNNIQVNQLCIGAVDTEMTDPTRQELLMSSLPVGRVSSPREIAEMTCFLASSAADYVTGTSIVIDGGLTLGFCATRPDL
jgi:NAD(P)-dependent dehydrogenase (short-subunit alcohol dehydrogenase family)